MILIDILQFAGGIALFLFGMNIMSKTLTEAYRERASRLLDCAASNSFLGLLLGFVITALIQSSSAMMVMIVGAVGSGILSMSSAAAVILGANIGTTATPWLVSLVGIEGESLLFELLKPSSLGPIAGIFGIVMLMGRKRNKGFAYILLGFCTLMEGLGIMSAVAKPLADNEVFISVLHRFENPFFGVLTGIVVTAVLQSSSASIGILQVLSTTGVLTVGGSVPLIIGQNIGTCITGLLASIGGNAKAARTAMFHVWFNIFGGVIFGMLFALFSLTVGRELSESSATSGSIAVVHTLFNALAVIILYPFRGRLVKLSELTIRRENLSDKA